VQISTLIHFNTLFNNRVSQEVVPIACFWGDRTFLLLQLYLSCYQKENHYLSQYKLKRAEIFLTYICTHIKNNMKVWAQMTLERRSYQFYKMLTSFSKRTDINGKIRRKGQLNIYLFIDWRWVSVLIFLCSSTSTLYNIYAIRFVFSIKKTTKLSCYDPHLLTFFYWQSALSMKCSCDG